MSEPYIIDDSNWRQTSKPPAKRRTGLVPRDFRRWPCGSIPGLPLRAIPEFSDQEIEDRLADQQRHKSGLLDIMLDCKVPVLDQDGWPFCWAFSTTAAVMALRAVQNQPTVKLSGWMPGCFVKNYRSEGGWCEQSLQHARSFGICAHDLFPGPKRQYDTPEMRKDALTRQVVEWSDLDNGDRNKRQLASLLLSNIPVMVEFNWWAHSVLGVRIVRWNPFELEIWNSWTPDWGTDGRGILTGSRAIPDNMACPYVTIPS